MKESEFNQIAEQTLIGIEDAIESSAEKQLWCIDNDPDKELFAQLALYCSQQAGETVTLDAPDD